MATTDGESAPRKSADELVAEGRRLKEKGNFVVFLYPSQEWMAVQLQVPFLRYGRLPRTESDTPSDG